MKIMIYYCNENPRLDLKSYAKEWLWLHYSLCVYVSTLRWRNVTIADFLCHSLTILNVNTAIFLYISVSKHIKKHIFHIQICIFCQLYCISFYVYHMKHLFWNVVRILRSKSWQGIHALQKDCGKLDVKQFTFYSSYSH